MEKAFNDAEVPNPGRSIRVLLLADKRIIRVKNARKSPLDPFASNPPSSSSSLAGCLYYMLLSIQEAWASLLYERSARDRRRKGFFRVRDFCKFISCSLSHFNGGEDETYDAKIHSILPTLNHAGDAYIRRKRKGGVRIPAKRRGSSDCSSKRRIDDVSSQSDVCFWAKINGRQPAILPTAKP